MRFIPVSWISCVELEVFVELSVDVEEETNELWEDTEDSSDGLATLIETLELLDVVETPVDDEEETDELWEDTDDSSDGLAALIEILEFLDDMLSLSPQAARDSIVTKVSVRTKNLFILKTSRFNKILRKTRI